ncbi:MAG TPA: mitomycin antibiotics/polyketide fumonisin biosynthesis protein [Mycobacterium sp.]|nr:mitomycin antibiotics/polyketide fumonisin biosynthesis protein [Mycobacterium sp.]
MLKPFASDGYVRVANAVSRPTTDAARATLWDALGLSPTEPAGWTEAVRWTADLTGVGPFADIVKSPVLASALNAICGVGGWRPRGSLGNIPVRFPVSPPADDRGWHIDDNTPTSDGSWTVTGRPHTLLLLTLLSEIGPDDAPTRIRVGSHHDVARVLGPEPVEFVAAGRLVDRVSAAREVVRATGDPGDMYAVHPFTVHPADIHRGRTPRFMAQAPIVLSAPLTPSSTSALACIFTT